MMVDALRATKRPGAVLCRVLPRRISGNSLNGSFAVDWSSSGECLLEGKEAPSSPRDADWALSLFHRHLIRTRHCLGEALAPSQCLKSLQITMYIVFVVNLVNVVQTIFNDACLECEVSRSVFVENGHARTEYGCL